MFFWPSMQLVPMRFSLNPSLLIDYHHKTPVYNQVAIIWPGSIYGWWWARSKQDDSCWTWRSKATTAVSMLHKRPQRALSISLSWATQIRLCSQRCRAVTSAVCSLSACCSGAGCCGCWERGGTCLSQLLCCPAVGRHLQVSVQTSRFCFGSASSFLTGAVASRQRL